MLSMALDIENRDETTGSILELEEKAKDSK